MKTILVPDYHGAGNSIIPLDNIAYVTEYEGVTRIYLRHIASVNTAWYVLTTLSVSQVLSRIVAEEE